MKNNIISIQGKAKQVDAVRFEIKQGVLYVSSSGIPFKNKAVVYIPVRLLNRLTIRGGVTNQEIQEAITASKVRSM